MSTTHHPQPEPASCSASSDRLGEPLAGTGPQAVAWLAIEQPGPWGRRAVTESHLDLDLGRELELRAAATGVRIALIRRSGRHALDQGENEDSSRTPDDDQARHHPRRVLLAHTTPGRAALLSLTLTDPQHLLDLDFAALAAGDWAAGGLISSAAAQPDPVLLVCTNGKRDRCCAMLGRALSLDLAELMAAPGAQGVDVWECDHLGGHRFAPTAMVLPTGYTYGRLDAASGAEAVEAARRGQMLARLCRGRSTWNQRGQAAELALRAELQEFAADAVLVTGERPTGDGTWDVNLTVHTAAYRVSVAQRAADEPRAESCGKALGTPIELGVRTIEKLG